MRKGSMKTDLNPLADSINKICKKNDINLNLSWIRCTENATVDRLSRFLDLDDWGITNEFFQLIQNEWGYCTCDTFATAENAKLPIKSSSSNGRISSWTQLKTILLLAAFRVPKNTSSGLTLKQTNMCKHKKRQKTKKSKHA